MTNPEQRRYSMLIQWSDEDNAYLVTLPEWTNVNSGGPHTHGDTYVEAAMMGVECLEMLMASSDDLPEPDVHVSKDEADAIDRKWEELMATPASHAFLDELEEEAMREYREGRTEEGGFGRGQGQLIDESGDKPRIAGTAITVEAVLERFVFADSLNEAIETLTQDYDLTEKQILAAIGFGALCVHDEYYKAEDNEPSLTPEQHKEIEALKALPDDQIDTSDIPEITDFSGFQRGLFYRVNKDYNEQTLNKLLAVLGRIQSNSTSSIELWRSDPRKAFDQHLEFIQCFCTGIDASLEKLRKGMEEHGLFSDDSEEQ